MNNIINERWKIFIWTSIAILILVVTFVSLGYSLKPNYLNEKYSECDEFCFHHFSDKPKETIGYYWNGICMCQNE